MSIFNKLVNSVVYNVGDAVGDAIGDAIDKVADQATDNIVDDMRRENEVKEKEHDNKLRMSELELQDEFKKRRLPSHCPFCKAPTTGQLTCEYCNSKIL